MLNRDNIDLVKEYLLSHNDYEKAMIHFMSLTEDPSLIQLSDNPPPEIVQQIVTIYGPAAPKINMAVGLEGVEVLSGIKFFYLEEYDLVHGMFQSEGVYGVTIFFPKLKKGVMSLIQQEGGQTFYIRLSDMSEYS